jgi:IS30 family transposase
VNQGFSVFLAERWVRLMTNHINSIARKSLNDRSPFELAEMLLNKKLLNCLEIKLIQPDAVLLKPILLKH